MRTNPFVQIRVVSTIEAHGMQHDGINSCELPRRCAGIPFVIGYALKFAGFKRSQFPDFLAQVENLALPCGPNLKIGWIAEYRAHYSLTDGLQLTLMLQGQPVELVQ